MGAMHQRLVLWLLCVRVFSYYGAPSGGVWRAVVVAGRLLNWLPLFFHGLDRGQL